MSDIFLNFFKNRPLFKECLEALGKSVFVLDIEKTTQVVDLFEKMVPLIGSRADFNKFRSHIEVESAKQVISDLKKLLSKDFDKSIYILWSTGGIPVLKTDLNTALAHIEDITCLGFETWLFNPKEGYVVEFYYLGEIKVGLLNKAEKPLFSKCVELIKGQVLSNQESEKAFEAFKQLFPLAVEEKVDWSKISKKVSVESPKKIVSSLINLLGYFPDKTVYIRWNDKELPIVKAQLDGIIKHFDIFIKVSSYVIIFNPFLGYIIEVSSNKEITIGMVTNSVSKEQ